MPNSQDQNNIKHIAIIMDGNRRWAKSHNLSTQEGHKAGVKTLKNIIKLCPKYGIEHLTAYAFSTENWGRENHEVQFLFKLFEEVINREIDELNQAKVKLQFIGDVDALPQGLQENIKNSYKKQESLIPQLTLNIALNYSGQSEIINATKQIAREVQNNQINLNNINTELLESHLWLRNPAPDILIRPGGEKRLSNYLLWQLAYSELIFIDTLWPDFSETELVNCIEEYKNRHRRFGK